MDAPALDKRQVRAAFDRAAGTYDAAAVLQRTIADRMLERLELIRHAPAVALDGGCGTGYCTRALKRRYRGAVILGLDLSRTMARRARREENWFAAKRYLCGDLERLPIATASVDLLLSNLTLQWCALDAALAECRRVLRPGGLLMFTSFGPDTLKELRAAWAAVDDRPHVHTFLDMHDVGDALVRAGFADPVIDVEHFTLTYRSVREVLADLKHLGAHNVATGRSRALTGKTRFTRFRTAYEGMAQAGQIPATFEAVYGHAWCPAGTSAGRRETAEVPISSLKQRR